MDFQRCSNLLQYNSPLGERLNINKLHQGKGESQLGVLEYMFFNTIVFEACSTSIFSEMHDNTRINSQDEVW